LNKTVIVEFAVDFVLLSTGDFRRDSVGLAWPKDACWRELAMQIQDGMTYQIERARKRALHKLILYRPSQ